MTAATTRSGEQIQRDLLEELEWDAHVQFNEVGVSVEEWVETLTGWVVVAWLGADPRDSQGGCALPMNEVSANG